MLLCYPSKLPRQPTKQEKQTGQIGPLPPDFRCLWKLVFRNALAGYSLSFVAQFIEHSLVHGANHPIESSFEYTLIAAFVMWFVWVVITPMVRSTVDIDPAFLRSAGELLARNGPSSD